MNYTPKKIKRILKKCINKIASVPEVFANNPGKDFKRKRKLTFKNLLQLVLSMGGKSIRGELMDYFNLNPALPSVSAFVQQRNKINYRAFETLFHNFTNAVDEKKLFKGYRLIAVDGSDLHVPTNKDEKASFYEGAIGQKPYNLLHLNVFYDLQKKIYADAVVHESKNGNERKSFVTLIERDNSVVPTIYIADRGYESYNSIAHVIEKKQKFLFRVQDLNAHGIMSGLNLPDQEEFDIVVAPIKLTRYATNNAKLNGFKILNKSAVFDYLPPRKNRKEPILVYTMCFRVVRFKLSDNAYEILITNISNDEFSVEELKKLYSMRWGVESSFRDLKYAISMSYFHTKKTETILQEIFARLTMYNFAELITSHVVVKQKNRKHPYRINFAAAVHICRNFFLKNISPLDVEALLLKHLLPIRQGFANPRRGSPKIAPSFTYRIP